MQAAEAGDEGLWNVKRRANGALSELAHAAGGREKKERKKRQIGKKKTDSTFRPVYNTSKDVLIEP